MQVDIDQNKNKDPLNTDHNLSLNTSRSGTEEHAVDRGITYCITHINLNCFSDCCKKKLIVIGNDNSTHDKGLELSYQSSSKYAFDVNVAKDNKEKFSEKEAKNTEEKKKKSCCNLI